MALPLTLTADFVFAPTTGSGAPRGADMGDARTWGTEIEAILGSLTGLENDEVSATTYTPVSADHLRTVFFTANTDITITLPSTFTSKFAFSAMPIGNGLITFTEGSGIQIRCGLDVPDGSPPVLHRKSAYVGAPITAIYHPLTTTWWLVGATQAV